MKSIGICDICSRPSRVLYTCFKCLRKVCTEDYTADGRCVECASGKTPAAGPSSEIVVPESAKPTKVEPGDIKT